MTSTMHFQRGAVTGGGLIHGSASSNQVRPAAAGRHARRRGLTRLAASLREPCAGRIWVCAWLVALLALISPGWQTARAQTPFFMPVVTAVSPNSVSQGPGSYSHDFDVTNTGNISGNVYVNIRCVSAVTSCSSLWTSVALNAHESKRITMNYTAPYGGAGAVWVKVVSWSDTSRWNEAKLSVQVNLNNLVADGTPTNSTNQDPQLCAASCFTPVYSQGTVPYHTLGVARNITLVYNGDQAAPSSMVYANVSITGGRAVAYYLVAAKKSNGDSLTFSNGEKRLRFAGTTSGQIRLGGNILPDGNGLATNGTTPVSLLVTAKYTDSTSETQLIEPKIMSIDERASRVARGWSIAGLQRLDVQADSNVVITDGTGSGTYFASNQSCSTCFYNAGGDPSVLKKDISNNWTRSYPDSTKALFNSTGQLTSIVDRFGNTTAFAYDGSGRLIEVRDPILTYSGGQKAIVLVYGAYGLASVQNPSTAANAKSGGRITYFTVASDSTLRAIKDPDGDSTSFAYDGNRRLQRVIDRRGDTTTYTLDTNGRLQYVDLSRVQLYNGLASPRRQYFDSRMSGVPTSATSVTAWTPALVSSLADTVSDALGNKTSFTDDPWGQPLRVSEPLGRTTTITRSGIYPTVVQYPEGGVDSTTYSNGLVTSQRLAGENRVNIRYGGWGQPDSVGGTGWPSVRASLGPGGRVDWTRVGPADSLRMSYSYDTRGRLTSQTDSMGHVTRFTYDAVTGNLDSTISPGNRFTKFTYDAYGRMSTQQSNDEPARSVAYDSVDRVVATYDSVNAVPTQYTYDKLYLTRVQGAKGQVYKFERNALGWVTTRFDPADTLSRYDSYAYDSTGRLHSWTNRRGQQINYTYDVLGRLTSKSGTNTSTDSLAYSSDGRIAVMWNSVQRDSVLSDSTGWVKSVITHVSGQRFQVDYRPNSIQRIDSVLISGSGITFAARHYGWNTAIGTLDTISVNSAITTFARNKDLLPRQTHWPSLTRTDDWTAIHSVSQSAFSVPGVDSLLSRRYSYNSRFGMQDYITEQGSNYRTQQRTYDGMRRLAGLGDDVYAPASCGSDPASGYLCPTSTQSTLTFDAVGNRTDAVDATYMAGNRMTQFNGYTYSYDLDGNDTSKVNVATNDRKSYEWSAEGLLNRVLVNGVEKVRFEYNAGGQLVHRYTNGTLDRTYLWAGGQLLAELNATATQRLSEYAYSPGADLPFAIITGATSITSVRYHLIDEVGNVIGVMNGSAIDEQISYDDWGVATTTGNTDNRLLFKGLLWEPDAGLYYMRARWYDPGPGRFISEDPIGLQGGINEYAFAGGDPVNGSDPSGQRFSLKKLLRWAPVIAVAAITGVGAAGSALTLAQAFTGAVHAVASSFVGALASGTVESFISGRSLVGTVERNWDYSSAWLAVSALAIAPLSGGINGAGSNRPWQGYVSTPKAFPPIHGHNWFGGALTIGSAALFNGDALGEPIYTGALTTFAEHEFGHTMQFVALSLFGRNPWLPYLGAGFVGMLGEHGFASGVGCAWEKSASWLTVGNWEGC